jgi:hypothetical protein
MAGQQPLKLGGLLVSQSRFEREPRRSDSYSVIHFV